MTTASDNGKVLSLATIRAQLDASHGRQYWRSLEEVAETQEFREFLEREFPTGASILESEVDRRQFLKIIGASLALAGLNACMRQPAEKIVPYVRQPEEIVAGNPLYFATAMVRSGIASGVLVKSNMGRPTKVEGNPDHPASLGATGIYEQASILELYDPDRSQVVINAGEISTWTAFLDALGEVMKKQQAVSGAGLRILTETVSSPTLYFQIQALLQRFPKAKWHQYEPLHRNNSRLGALLAFGESVETTYRFSLAEVIVSFDADFLFDMPGHLRYMREFADKRRVRAGQAKMNRLYVVESAASTTGAMADHRISFRPSGIKDVARALARELGIIEVGDAPPMADHHRKWVASAVRDLQTHRGAGIVLAGAGQPPLVHALVHAINHALGNNDRIVIHTESVEAGPVDQVQSLQELVTGMNAGEVQSLIILGGNPVYNAPVDLQFADALSKVPLRVRLGLYDDETSQLCHWHIPETHYLESWSDARAFDGTITVIQPLIAPLYGGKSAHELIAALLGQQCPGHDIVREYWKAHGLDDDNHWHAALHDGVVPNSALPPKKVTLQSVDWQRAQNSDNNPSLEILFCPDPTVWDGRFANNGWLQELPKPMTRLTWDNAALVSPKTAEQLGVSGEDVVELRFEGRSVRAPVWIVPGQADGVVIAPLGYGRKRAGHVGDGAGFDAYSIRPSDAQWFGKGLEVRKTGERWPLACTQHHQTMEGRDLVRVGTLHEFLKNPAFAHNEINHPSLYPEYKYQGYAWGMSIDLTACVGCSACVVACQSENNIPIVGKDQVSRGREMHWIRIDRYFKGGLDDPEVYFEPVPCMHCENAPCEVVCPVGATVHSDEGLNQMVYNRCVGTRYCSNNCPYKVRRFNFYQFSDLKTPSLKLMRNPDVTVRNRGVMEKCTYCVQRINAVKITAENENRSVRDGEIVPACAQACPAQAIVFGDINDRNSRVSKLKAEPLNYGLLVELNARPRTTYLARIRNPNPEMET